MHKRLLLLALLAVVCTASSYELDPVMTAQLFDVRLWDHGEGDYYVEADARTMLSESGYVDVQLWWELKDAQNGQIIFDDGYQGDWDTVFAQTILGESGSDPFFDEGWLDVWTEHYAEVGSWWDADSNYVGTTCTNGAECDANR